ANNQPVSSLDVQAPAGSHFFIDQRHVTNTPPELAPAAAPADNQSNSQQYHLHHGPHRQHQTPKSTTTKEHPEHQAGMAAGLFRLHGELASYSGLIVTLVLAASAALMYLTVVVPSQTPSTDYGNSFETYGSNSLEIPQFRVETSVPVAPQMASTRLPVDPFEITSPETSADAESTVSSDLFSSDLSADSQFTWENAIQAAQEEPASELSANTTESTPDLIPVAEQQIEPSEEPALPMNDASAFVYPTTEHPAWDFTKLGVLGLLGDPQSATTGPATIQSEIAKPAMVQRPEAPAPLPVNR
ncbi:MAG: hypothetical protein MI725_05520, partial [Pirellulales bacterium]|nr:hypothetical protein [Pirellulales bacterium]